MRNLKRALSLALATVMTLGLMVVGTGAAGYTDVTSEDNQEAIEVLQAVGIMTGVTDDEFNPDGLVTRNQMAVIMSQLLNLDYDYYRGINTFTDVPSWAAPYVAACVAEGVTAGIGDGLYGGEYNVTAAQAALMIMKALGYFQYQGDFTPDWQVATIRQGSYINLFDGVDANAEQALTRGQVAQMVLNGLKANMVEFTGDVGTQITVGDITVDSGYRAEYSERTSAEPKYGTLVNDRTHQGSEFRYIVQLGEELYDGDLRLTHPDDAMNRVSNRWTYKTEVVGNYTQEPDYTFVVEKTQTAAKLIDDNMGKSIDDTRNIASVNGGTEGTTAALNLNVGDIVEIYMDNSTTETLDTVAVTRYSVDRLTGDATTKGTGGDLEVRLPGTAMSSYRPVDEVIGYAGLKKDDVIYYYEDNENVYHVFKAESFDGQLTSIKNKDPYIYVVDGDDCVANGSMTPEAMNIGTPVFNTEYRFWTDDNGYVIYGDELEDALSDYVVIQDIEYIPGEGVNREGRVEARLVKMDGTTQVVTINSIINYVSSKTCKWMGSTVSSGDATVNSDAASTGIQGRYLVVSGNALNGTVDGFVDDMFFTYTINSDGEYDLTYVNGSDVAVTEINGSTGIALTAGKVTDGTGTIPVTDDTVFVIAKTSNGTKFDVYTGKNNAPDLTTAKGAYVTEDGVVTYMYIDAYVGSTFSGNTVFIMDDSPIAYYEVKKDDGTKYGYNTYKAAVNGVYEEVKIAASALGTVTATGASVAVGFFSPTYNEDGVITNLVVASNADPLAYGYKLTGTTLVTGKSGAAYDNAYVCEDDVPVFYMDEDGDVSELTAADLSNDANDQIYVVTTNSTDNKVKFLVIMEKDADETGFTLTVNGTAVTSFGSESGYDSTGKAVTALSATASASDTIALTVEAGCTVKYEVGAADWTLANTQVVSGGTPVNIGSHAPGTGWTIIQIIAEDTSETVIVIK